MKNIKNLLKLDREIVVQEVYTIIFCQEMILEVPSTDLNLG